MPPDRVVEQGPSFDQGLVERAPSPHDFLPYPHSSVDLLGCFLIVNERTAMKCPSCQHEKPPDARFCIACGQGLAAPASSDSITASIPSGERRQATIVFSDLSGYTAMNERLDPEEVQEIMSRIKAEAVRIVESHGGIVNQFVGDEVVALFGIP
ncbi:MAG: zinc ribbon domain-containing protein, partial [SAR324 cluster bacterium]|nr:zinc ribbon domain-containing protein [SAR324 cluster bacterium]